MKTFEILKYEVCAVQYTVEAESIADALAIIAQVPPAPDFRETLCDDKTAGMPWEQLTEEQKEELAEFLGEDPTTGEAIVEAVGRFHEVTDEEEGEEEEEGEKPIPVDCSTWTYEQCREKIEGITGKSAENYNQSCWPACIVDSNPWFPAKIDPIPFIEECKSLNEKAGLSLEDAEIESISTAEDALKFWLAHANLGNIGSIRDWRQYASELINGN